MSVRATSNRSFHSVQRARRVERAAPPRGDASVAVPTTPSTSPAAPLTRLDVLRGQLLAANAYALRSDPAAVGDKLKKLEENPFSWFRGTAALFYADLAKDVPDDQRPRILLNGDPHPENFATMGAKPGSISFGLDDFDEASKGPFSWDLRRATVGFALAARQGGLDAVAERAVVDGFLAGYRRGLESFDGSKAEREPVFAERSHPGVLDEVFRDASTVDPAAWLAKFANHDRFIASERLMPASTRVGELQKVVDEYRKGLDKPWRQGLTVKDVAERVGSGTASLGLHRLWLLVEGKGGHGDVHILELKECTTSVLAPWSGGKAHHVRGKPIDDGMRIADAQRRMRDADPLHGHVTLGGRTYVVRERSPHAQKVNLAKLDAHGLAALAEACGRALAHAHARLDGKGDHLERRLLRALDKGRLEKHLANDAVLLADRVTADHAIYLAARKRGELAAPADTATPPRASPRP